MLYDRHGDVLRLGTALFWSLTWGVGVGLGIALGGWLTLVGGSGSPGIGGLDPATDLIVLPLAALVVVTVLHLGGQFAAAVLRSRAKAHGGE